jgi:hypothetical protein
MIKQYTVNLQKLQAHSKYNEKSEEQKTNETSVHSQHSIKQTEYFSDNRAECLLMNQSKMVGSTVHDISNTLLQKRPAMTDSLHLDNDHVLQQNLANVGLRSRSGHDTFSGQVLVDHIPLDKATPTVDNSLDGNSTSDAVKSQKKKLKRYAVEMENTIEVFQNEVSNCDQKDDDATSNDVMAPFDTSTKQLHHTLASQFTQAIFKKLKFASLPQQQSLQISYNVRKRLTDKSNIMSSEGEVVLLDHSNQADGNTEIVDLTNEGNDESTEVPNYYQHDCHQSITLTARATIGTSLTGVESSLQTNVHIENHIGTNQTCSNKRNMPTNQHVYDRQWSSQSNAIQELNSSRYEKGYKQPSVLSQSPSHSLTANTNKTAQPSTIKSSSKITSSQQESHPNMMTTKQASNTNSSQLIIYSHIFVMYFHGID